MLGALALVALPFLTNSCDGEPVEATGGAVSQAQADGAIGGLCEISANPGAAFDEQRAIFYDRTHDTLHAIAAEAQAVDVTAAAGLLEAKQVVESDLEEPDAPGDFPAHVEALLEATRVATAEIGLNAAVCDG
jgi:hypothetical protein